MFRRGRVSLLIGIAFLASSLIAGEMASQMLVANPFAEILRESLLIGGWVAMWRPLQIFLYDWWPLRADLPVHASARHANSIQQVALLRERRLPLTIASCRQAS